MNGIDQRLINGTIFLDAAQHLRVAIESGDFGKKSDGDKLAFVERLLHDASERSPLLEGREKEVTGEAWSRFLRASDPAKLKGFIDRLSSPELLKLVDKLPSVTKLNETYAHNSIGLIGSLFGTDFMKMGDLMKNIAQETGMVDYTKGETLVAALRKFSEEIRTERGIPKPKPPEEQPLEHMSVLPASFNKPSGITRG